MAHVAMAALVKLGYVDRIITQNVDALHLRSGVPRNRLSELHGNLFMEQCKQCGRECLNDVAVPTVGRQPTGHACRYCDERKEWPLEKRSEQAPIGSCRDILLDWDDPLPDADWNAAVEASREAEMSVAIGTSLQMVPARNLPGYCLGKKQKGKFVVINRSWTARDDQATLVIRATADEVMSLLIRILGNDSPELVTQCEKPITRQGYRVGVRVMDSDRQKGLRAEICVVNGDGYAPGLTWSRSTQTFLHLAKEPSNVLTPLLESIPSQWHVPAFCGVPVERDGCVYVSVAAYGEPMRCSTKEVNEARWVLLLPSDDRQNREQMSGPRDWHIYELPSAGAVCYHVDAFRDVVMERARIETSRRVKYSLSYALAFYREANRRYCVCVGCGTQVASQMRVKHLKDCLLNERGLLKRKRM